MSHHYETPDALRHDAHMITEDARALIEATAQITDKKVAEARRRLGDALDHGREMYASVQQKVVRSAKAADHAVHEHPYQGMAIAFGVGALSAFLLCRRH